MTLANHSILAGLTVAFGIGLLIGIEREQRSSGAGGQGVAGVRTFVLISLIGAICALMGTGQIAVGSAFVGLAALLSYRKSYQDDPGLTTEMAMFATCLLGALAMREPEFAAACGVGVALMLALKSRLHAFSREVLTTQELHDGLLLGASALIVLPLLPDRAIDPWQVVNPYKLWRLVVLVMAINALGYVAQRVLGTRLGLPISGLAGGFVSATATIAAMGGRAKAHPEQRASCVAAGMLANVATIAQLAVVIGALSPLLLQRLSLALVVTGVVTAALAGVFGLAAWRAVDDQVAPLKGRPFQPMQALAFVAMVATILALSAALAHGFGEAGMFAASAVAGLADAHASAASAAQVFQSGQIDVDAAALAVLIGLAANTASKAAVAFGGGGRDYALRLLPGLVLMLVVFAIVLVWRS